MTTEPIQRSEYEQFVKLYEIRHSELRLENKEMETELKSQINGLSLKMDTLSTQVNRRSLDVWKLVATSAVSLIGGYLLSYFQHLLGH